jgi:hypothetical protein
VVPLLVELLVAVAVSTPPTVNIVMINAFAAMFRLMFMHVPFV